MKCDAGAAPEISKSQTNSSTPRSRTGAPQRTSCSVFDGSMPIERQVMDQVMSNRRHDATFTIENGNQIVMEGTLSGTMPNGMSGARPTKTVWAIGNGEIVQQLDDGTGFDKLDNPLATMLGGLDISFTKLARENNITLPDFYAKAVADAGM